MKKVLSLMFALLLLFSSVTIAFADDEEIIEPLKYVVLGDSIAFGAGIINKEDAVYGKMVADTNGYDYVNYGHNGDRTNDLLRKLDDYNIASDVGEADIISVSIGGNNVLRGNIPYAALNLIFGISSYINSAVDSFRSDFGAIIEKLKSLNPDALILMQTVYNPSKIFKNNADRAIVGINDIIYDYLEENPEAYTIVDIYGAFDGQSGLIAMDGIHPNGKGNKVIAAEILSVLASLGYGEATQPVIMVEPADTYSFAIYYLKTFFAILVS